MNIIHNNFRLILRFCEDGCRSFLVAFVDLNKIRWRVSNKRIFLNRFGRNDDGLRLNRNFSFLWLSRDQGIVYRTFRNVDLLRRLKDINEIHLGSLRLLLEYLFDIQWKIRRLFMVESVNALYDLILCWLVLIHLLNNFSGGNLLSRFSNLRAFLNALT